MTTPIFRPARIAAAVATLFALGASQAHGAAFALQENSASQEEKQAAALEVSLGLVG